MQSKVVTIVLLCLALFAYTQAARNANENILLQHFVDFVKGEAVSSGAFLYDQSLSGPGGVPSFVNDFAQTLAETSATNQAEITGAAYSSAITSLQSDISSSPCSFTQFVSLTTLSPNFINVYDNIRIVSYYGSYPAFANQFHTFKTHTASQNTTAANNMRRILTCSLYDNLAFGLKLSGSNVAFIAVAIASDPTSACPSGNTVLSASPAYFCPASCNKVLGVSGGITHVPAPSNYSYLSAINSTDFAVIWSETSQNGLYLSAGFTSTAFNVVDYFLYDTTTEVVYTSPTKFIDNNSGAVAGISVSSWFLHFNPNALSYVSGSVVFANQIVGAIYSNKLNNDKTAAPNRVFLSDATFQPDCTPYGNRLVIQPYRGLETQTVGAAKTVITDSFKVSGTKFEIANFSVASAGFFDEVRILTACDDGPKCDPSIVPATTGNFIIKLITPPASIEAFTSNTLIFVWRERSVIVSEPIPVDHLLTAGSAYTFNYGVAHGQSAAQRPTLTPGTAYTSWYFHAEPVSQAYTFNGRATFGNRIVGLVYASGPNWSYSTFLDSDDIFGDTCTDYTELSPTSGTRGLESGDSIAVDAAGTQITVRFVVQTSSNDNIRIFTLCESGAV